jgi:hypothetical protein
MDNDNEKNFAANPITKWQGIEISYKYNSDGFRTHEFSDFLCKKVNIAVGCSLTEGVGIPIENVWPSILEQKLGIPLLNLGLGGGSTDTVARIITNISGLFQIEKVFVLWPDKHRFEFYDEDRNSIVPIGSWNASDNYLWNMSNSNSLQRLYKNKNILDLLSKQHGFEVIEITVENALETISRVDPARDDRHFGITPNIKLAEWFLSLIKAQ